MVFAFLAFLTKKLAISGFVKNHFWGKNGKSGWMIELSRFYFLKRHGTYLK